MENGIVDRLYRFFWLLLTVLTGVLAGFMLSHAIMLGRFFTWYVTSGKMDLLRASYSAFRREASPQILYDFFLYLHLALGAAWAIFAFLRRRSRLVALTAGLSTFWVGAVFLATSFSGLEEAVLSGSANAATAAKYAALNVPLHAGFALAYLASLVALLIVGTRFGRKGKSAGAAA